MNQTELIYACLILDLLYSHFTVMSLLHLPFTNNDFDTTTESLLHSTLTLDNLERSLLSSQFSNLDHFKLGLKLLVKRRLEVIWPTGYKFPVSFNRLENYLKKVKEVVEELVKVELQPQLTELPYLITKEEFRWCSKSEYSLMKFHSSENLKLFSDRDRFFFEATQGYFEQLAYQLCPEKDTTTIVPNSMRVAMRLYVSKNRKTIDFAIDNGGVVLGLIQLGKLHYYFLFRPEGRRQEFREYDLEGEFNSPQCWFWGFLQAVFCVPSRNLSKAFHSQPYTPSRCSSSIIKPKSVAHFDAINSLLPQLAKFANLTKPREITRFRSSSIVIDSDSKNVNVVPPTFIEKDCVIPIDSLPSGCLVLGDIDPPPSTTTNEFMTRLYGGRVDRPISIPVIPDPIESSRNLLPKGSPKPSSFNLRERLSKSGAINYTYGKRTPSTATTPTTTPQPSRLPTTNPRKVRQVNRPKIKLEELTPLPLLKRPRRSPTQPLITTRTSFSSVVPSSPSVNDDEWNDTYSDPTSLRTRKNSNFRPLLPDSIYPILNSPSPSPHSPPPHSPPPHQLSFSPPSPRQLPSSRHLLPPPSNLTDSKKKKMIEQKEQEEEMEKVVVDDDDDIEEEEADEPILISLSGVEDRSLESIRPVVKREANSSNDNNRTTVFSEYVLMKALFRGLTPITIERESTLDLTKSNTIASGYFKDTVTHPTDPINRVVAVFKELDLSSLPIRLNELSLLMKFRGHEGFSQLLSVVINDEEKITGFTMRRHHSTFKELLQNHRTMSPEFKLGIIFRVVCLIEELHDSQVAHRDLSEVNMMVDEGLYQASLTGKSHDSRSRKREQETVKPKLSPSTFKDLRSLINETPHIIDFGKSAYLSKKFTVEFKSVIGVYPPAVTAPELLPDLLLTTPDFGFPLYRSIVTLPKKKRTTETESLVFDGLKEDVFSLGILIYRIVTGLMPWGGLLETSLIELRQVVEDEDLIEFHIKRDIPSCPKWHKLLFNALDPDPLTRWSTRSVRVFMETHSYALYTELVTLR